MNFDISHESDKKPAEGDYLFVIRDQKILLDIGNDASRLPRYETVKYSGFDLSDSYCIGTLNGNDSYAYMAGTGTGAPHGMKFTGLRRLFGVLRPVEYAMAIRAMGIINWDSTYRFCTVCGSKALRHLTILAKQCGACGFTMFPKISPAVIVAVEKEDKILLARAGRFTENLYSVLAGFAEPGESLEDTVRREIKEEVGINVKDIRYFGSQPWPYPDSLMIGFTAAWSLGEIVVDNNEITDARWFSVSDLPLIPDKVSIARSLIDAFIEKTGKK